MDTKSKEAALDALKSLYNRGVVHLVGRTSYRSARANDIVLKCNREDIQFIETSLSSKGNHVVIIFQVLYGENGWVSGTYYAFVTDFHCLIGKEIEYKEF